MSVVEFAPFPKIARLRREIIITEKIDGTNASISISPGYRNEEFVIDAWFDEETSTDMVMRAGSRNGWVKPNAEKQQTDNHGFAAWAVENAVELRRLGPGTHFGEWWGRGIQRGYGQTEKHFSLFNTSRWHDKVARPTYCLVVPVMATAAAFESSLVNECAEYLRTNGSVVAPGFDKPEGIVVFHTAANICFKQTLVKDEEYKGKNRG